MRQDTKRRAIRRLKILEGQIRGLQRMVEREAYCIDILHQSSAVKEALSGIEDLILKNHLSTHVVEQIRNGRSAKAVREILEVYRQARRR
jgi:DNA-binding FrmR family transcriptional regulator